MEDRSIVLRLRQTLRPDAVAVVAALRKRGLEVLIISGDRPEAVAPVANALGVCGLAGGLNPAEKIADIEALKAQGRRVLMVGDGLNDAPALAAAHVSLSPISAADLTQAQADAVFLGERLRRCWTRSPSPARARALMRQNLWLCGDLQRGRGADRHRGLVTPLIAAAAMSGSSILVTLNALRARSRPAPQPPGPIATVPQPAPEGGVL